MRLDKKKILYLLVLILTLLPGCSGGKTLPCAFYQQDVSIRLGLTQEEVEKRIQSCGGGLGLFFCEGELSRIECLLGFQTLDQQTV